MEIDQELMLDILVGGVSDGDSAAIFEYRRQSRLPQKLVQPGENKKLNRCFKSTLLSVAPMHFHHIGAAQTQHQVADQALVGLY